MSIPKRAFQRYLYRLKVSVSYKNVLRTLDACIENKPPPPKVGAYELIQIKRALEWFRKAEGVVVPYAVRAENALLETAADTGDSTAVALLCGSRMSEENVPPEDWKHGTELLRQLMDSKFALAFKITGDLTYRHGRPLEASKFYEMAIENGLDDEKMRVECFRNVGHIAFTEGHLMRALHYFTEACRQSTDLKQVADCHFFLGQLREANREAARTHFENAAGAGFSNAFLPLGMLLLNYFGEVQLAKQWLLLAQVVDTTGSALVGLLDVYVRLNEIALAQSILARIRRRPDAEQLLAGRTESVKKVDALTEPVVSEASKDAVVDRFDI